MKCHRCKQPIPEGTDYVKTYMDDCAAFHLECFNRYEHYYGLDKPID